MANVLLYLLLFARTSIGAGQSGLIEGRVLNADGMPAVGVRVALQPVAQSAVLENITQTDTAGRYRIEGITPGKYLVVAGSVNYLTYFPGVAMPGNAEAQTVNAGGKVTAIDFTLIAAEELCPNCLKVSGQTKQPGGQGNQASITVSSLSGRVVGVARTAPDGSYEVQYLQPGLYRLRFVSAAGSIIDKRLELKSENVVINVDWSELTPKR
jgi:hypothetical protein